MRKLLLAASALVIAPLSSSAATYQINVAGSLDYAFIGGIYAYVDQTRGQSLGYVPIDDPSSPYYLPRFLDFSGFGSALIDTDAGPNSVDSVSNCTGILSWLCTRGGFSFDERTGTASSFSLDGGGTLEFGPFSGGSVGTFRFTIDVGGTAFSVGVVDYAGDFYNPGFGCGTGFYCEPSYLGSYEGEVIGGAVQSVVSASYDLTTYSISVIPLPPALPLLAAGVVGLGFIGRRRKKAV